MSIGDSTGRTVMPLVERVQHTHGFGVLRAAIEKAGKTSGNRIHATGLRGSSSVFLLEAIRDRIQRPCLVVCPDQEAAEDVISDLATLSNGRALLFPERDITPQRYEVQENLAVRGDRNEALLRIMAGSADIVVTSLLGFLEKTIPVDRLQSSRFSVAVGDRLDLDAIREYAVNAGYDAVSMVEEVGQFAVRGAILDLFDPSWDHPARVELLDDEVVSIRTFDLDSQRSIARIESITLLPASSVPFDENSAADLREYLRKRDFSPDDIRRIEEEITRNRHSYLWRRYAPALGVNGALLDFFKNDPLVWFFQMEKHNNAYLKLEKALEYARSRRDEEFPQLGLDDYLHCPAYQERYGVACVHVWDLSVVPGSSGHESQAANEADGENTGEPEKIVFEPIMPGETAVRFVTSSHPGVGGDLGSLVESVRKLHNKKTAVYIYSETTTQRERLADMLEENEELVHLPVGWITGGFVWNDALIAVFTDHEIFHRILPRPRKKRKKRRIQAFRYENLQLGDFVVHVDFGVGRFVGLEKVAAASTAVPGDSKDHSAECLVLRYLDRDRIYVPLDQMHLVDKYVGKEGVVPRLDRLGTNRWQKTREKARKAVEDTARDLLEIYAAREVSGGHAFGRDSQWQRDLEALFPYEETPHQLRAIEEIKSDMETERPMDRLVCGDVGYGKTEVAIRAAFKAAIAGKQVAVLVPTTLLAYQHYHSFRERVAAYPVEVRMLSRFVTKKDQRRIVEELKNGVADVVIGTHRLLSKDIAFKDLGLVVVDEEHRFGVKHKERLKRMIKSVDVLSLTATPIPRTLYMSLSGVREISIIDTPPRNRHPIKTEVVTFDEEIIQRAITEEISRGGQAFFVHNRVKSIYSLQALLERLLPGVRFCVAHGQMSERELEDVMLDFTGHKYDVLISTMIIESGLDMPNVNTIVVNRADRFGLAQLYQLRGRVGRREQQAYAYFLIPRQFSLTENAAKRLQAMEEFEELGSGYRLAMRDLEIRGAGNVLGIEQHGHVAAIGFEMYCRMLKSAVDRLRGQEEPPPLECRVESPYTCYLPDSYVEEADERMMLYKRMAKFPSIDDLAVIEDELVDRFGELPEPARYLLDLTTIKTMAGLQGIALVRFRLDRSAAERARAAARLKHALGGVSRVSRGAGAEVLAAGGNDRGVVEFEFAPGREFSSAQCVKLVETFGRRLMFKSGKPFGVVLTAEPADRLLPEAKNLLQVAYFSTKI